MPQIFKILENLNLEFLGFCDSKIKNKYSKLFPNDKKNISSNDWNQFEILEPLTFFGMYKFWVRKKQAKQNKERKKYYEKSINKEVRKRSFKATY